MRRRERDQEVNFWPSYADVTIAIIFVLILYYFLQQINIYLSDAYKVQKIKEYQKNFKSALRASLKNDSTCIGTIVENGFNQTVSFKSEFLFERGKWEFKNEKSRMLIETIGNLLKKYVDDGKVYRVVVEGHTNREPYNNNPYGNWNLSSERAVTVVKILDNILIKRRNETAPVEPSRLLSIAGFANYDFVKDTSGLEDLEESKRIQFFLEYGLSDALHPK